MKSEASEVTLGGQTYVILPKADYLRMRAGDASAVGVDALDYARTSIASGLRAARDHAGLTQEQLAAKLGKSQTLVARSEAGKVKVGEKYIAAVLKACGLPKDWQPKRPTKAAAER